ncbi:MAG TPA: hypothetical protein VMH04_03070 [Candidatus Solibacter sp.]|nr:hypothetical protein [Candidatus Solibacter sp.]
MTPQRSGWHFKGKTPWWFMLTAGLVLVDSAVHVALLATVSSWAQPRPDIAHSYRLPFRDGNIYFTSQLLGTYLDIRWIGIALILILAVLLFVNRDQLEKSG